MARPEEEDQNRYQRIVERIFLDRWRDDAREVAFVRDDITHTAEELGVELPKNLGDVLYSFRYRVPLPNAVRERAPAGTEWTIKAAGRAQYRFVAEPPFIIVPNPNYAETKIPDSTPGIIAKYAQGDEQALLAKVRYNRLIDIFTGVACHSLQSHLRTSIKGLGQVETDEIYVGVDRRGVHYVFPVQAKGGKDHHGRTQIEQDVALCRRKFPSLVCRPIGAQFITTELIALFEFEARDGHIAISGEEHYRLVAADMVTPDDLIAYRRRGD